MPQPVHYSHKIDFNFLPDSLLQRPKLAVLIAIISPVGMKPKLDYGHFLQL